MEHDSKHGAAAANRRHLDTAILVVSAAVALLYLYTAKFGQMPPFQQRGILLVFGFVVAFIRFPMMRGRPRWTIGVDVFLGLATLLAVYQLIRAEALTEPGSYYRPTAYDITLGGLLALATLEATRRTLGWILPALATVFFLYAIFGHAMPGILRHSQIDLSMAFYYVSLTSEGIFGLPLYVASTIVVTFLIFAAMLQQLGLMEFFVDLSSGLMGRYRGGPAKVAVIASAFLATLSGSSVANVAGTGSFTIPLMKRIGYRPNFAGAVEACASTGGVITPPVMGAAAFIMAEYLGVSYWAICVAAALPAFLYFLGVYVGVDLEAMKLGLKGLPAADLPSVRKTMLAKGYMLAPVFVLIYYLGVVKGSAMLAAFWAIMAILGVALVKTSTRRKLFRAGLVRGLADGMKDCVTVVTTCACAGIVIGVLVVTGLGMRLSTVLVDLSGGNLIVLLVLAAITCIILGMGITTTAIYLLMAMILAPAIVKLGVPPLAAHLFVFFLANLSNITPPVAVAVYVACGISGGEPFPTGWQACKLGAVLFIVPFFFSFHPGLILQGSLLAVTVSAVTAIVGVICLAFALANFSWWGKITLRSRVLFGMGGLALIYPTVFVSAAGAGMVLVGVVYEALLRKKGRLTDNTSLAP